MTKRQNKPLDVDIDIAVPLNPAPTSADAPRSATEYPLPMEAETPTTRSSPKRVDHRQVAWLTERLSERDWAVLEAVNRLHLATGFQLDRLCFAALTGRSRTVTRSLVLSRLTKWRVLHRLPRRVGGAKRGSSVAIYGLGIAGQRLLAERHKTDLSPSRIRSARMPSERFIRHILAVSELYVELTEAERNGLLILREFRAEPHSWWPDGQGTWLKPDAYVVTSNGRVDQLWWVEVDRATESIPALMRQLRKYVDFVNRGGLGPRRTVPRVLVSVPTEQHRQEVRRAARRLPTPADELCTVVTRAESVPWLVAQLPRVTST